MRAYFFGNMYLSSIQQGIQALHATARISVKYDNGTPQNEMYRDWATNHETVVCLNAGFGSEIIDIAEFFSNEENEFPFAIFHEEEAALNNAPTCVGIILPDYIYTISKHIRERTVDISDLKVAMDYALGVPVPETTGRIDQSIRILSYTDMLARECDIELLEVFETLKPFHFDLFDRLNRYGLAR